MKVVLSAAAQEAIERHAARTAPEECCGVLVGRAGAGLPAAARKDFAHYAAQAGVVEVLEAHPARNCEEARPLDRFEIEPADYLRIERGVARRPGLAVLGLYHSHPGGPARPGARDLAGFVPGWVYLIAGMEGGRVREMRAWKLDRPGSAASEVLLAMQA